MQAVIFADKNVIDFTFKISDKPFIVYVAESLIEFGVTELIFATNNTDFINQINEIKNLLINCKIKILTLFEKYNFIDILKTSFEYIKDEFYLINGNIFFDSDVSLMKDLSESIKNTNVLSLRMTKHLEGTNIYQIDNNYKIKNIVSGNILKENHIDGYTNSGRYLLKKSVISDLIQKYNLKTETDFINKLIKEDLICGLPLGGKFIDAIDNNTAQILLDWTLLERKSAQFMDRDGVINKNTGYAFGTDLELLEPAFQIVRQANKQNKYTIVVTNQSGVARGYYSETDVRITNKSIQDNYKKNNLKIDAFYYSPYYFEKATIDKYKKESLTRKPEPGMILSACEDYKIDLRSSSMIGDNPKADLIKLPYLKCEIVMFENL